jgi:hypothetical protein
MAFYDTTWYVNAGDQSTSGYYAVAKRPQNTAVVAGQIVRQFTAPAVNSERVFVCIIAGTTANVTDATWVLTRGAKTSDGTVTWQECTGASAVNGDLTNTANWTTAKATGAPTLGAIIKRNNGASYQICATAGALGVSEPAFSDTAGVTTTDSSAVWTSLGVVGNFTGGGAPHARLANAFVASWFVAGNTVYIGDNHAESQTTTLTITPTTTSTTIGKLLCHNHSGSYPPVASDLTTGATVSTTAAVNLTFNPGANGAFYTNGVTFNVGVGVNSTGVQLGINTSENSIGFYEKCSFQVAATYVGISYIAVGSTATTAFTNWNNCTVKFGNAGQYINVAGGSFNWQNTGQVLASGSTVPTALVAMLTSGNYSNIVLEALDLSQITANIFGTQTGNEGGTRLVKDCKLNAAVTLQQGGMTTAMALVEQVIRSNSGAVAYTSSRYAYEGTETTETSITRVGGAVDPTGQAQSRKIVTTANAQWLRPFQAEPYAAWNATTGANVTVTVYGTVNAAALPTNDDLWLEIEYLGSSAPPLGSIVTTTKANLLAIGAAVAADSSSWNGGGSGAGWSPFKLVATLSSPQPGMAGHIEARVRAAKAAATYYIDPQPVLT